MEETESTRGLTSSAGLVPGPYGEETMVCQQTHISNSRVSIWFGGDPFAYNTPVLFAQFVLIFLVTRSVFIFLKPLRQNLMSAQIIVSKILIPLFSFHIQTMRCCSFNLLSRCFVFTFFGLMVRGVRVSLHAPQLISPGPVKGIPFTPRQGSS